MHIGIASRCSPNAPSVSPHTTASSTGRREARAHSEHGPSMSGFHCVALCLEELRSDSNTIHDHPYQPRVFPRVSPEWITAGVFFPRRVAVQCRSTYQHTCDSRPSWGSRHRGPDSCEPDNGVVVARDQTLLLGMSQVPRHF
jgi:hypothetical protein